MNKLMILAALFFTLPLFSKETPQKQIPVLGYGIGKANNMEMAKNMAMMDVNVSLLSQLKGKEFTYQEKDGQITFQTKQDGVLSGSKTVSQIWLPSISVFMIVKSATLQVELSAHQEITTYDWETLGTKDIRNFNQFFLKMEQDALKKFIQEKKNSKEKLTGKLFTSKLKVSEPDENGEFKVSVSFSIILD
jgi:hypothetical protein